MENVLLSDIADSVSKLSIDQVERQLAELVMGWESWDNDGKFPHETVHYWFTPGDRDAGKDADIIGENWRPGTDHNHSMKAAHKVCEIAHIRFYCMAVHYLCKNEYEWLLIAPEQRSRAVLIAYMAYKLGVICP